MHHFHPALSLMLHQQTPFWFLIFFPPFFSVTFLHIFLCQSFTFCFFGFEFFLTASMSSLFFPLYPLIPLPTQCFFVPVSFGFSPPLFIYMLVFCPLFHFPSFAPIFPFIFSTTCLEFSMTPAFLLLSPSSASLYSIPPLPNHLLLLLISPYPPSSPLLSFPCLL